LQILPSKAGPRVVLGLGPDLQPQGNWTVVYQRNSHVGAELAAGYRRMALARKHQQVIEQALAQFRRRSRRKTWTSALAGIGGQRELGHQQQPAAHIPQTQIHFAGLIGKNPIVKHAFNKPLDLQLAIPTFRAGQYQKPGPNGADLATFDIHVRFGNALKQCNHRRSILFYCPEGAGYDIYMPEALQ